MKVKLIPKTKLGKLSLGFIIAMPILYSIGMSFADSLYKSVPAGKTILKDIVARPALALTMLSGMLVGILAFVAGVLSIIKKEERSVLVYISTLIGILHILFLISEVLSPH